MVSRPVDYSSKSMLTSQTNKIMQASVDIKLAAKAQALNLEDLRTLLLNWMGSDDFGSNKPFNHPFGSVKFTIK